MYEKKFAVADLVGNDIHVLRFFGANEKEAALACSEAVAKAEPEKAISCILAHFDANGHIVGNHCRFFDRGTACEK